MNRRDDKGSSEDWARFWDHAQQQAWDAWSQMARQALPQPNPQPDQLWKLCADGLERLWQGRSAQLTGTSQEVFSRVIDQGKGFLFLSHELLRAVETIQKQEEQGADWKLALRNAVDRIQEQLRQWSGVSVGQTALWGLPAEMWERLSSALTLAPGDWSAHLRAVAGKPQEAAQSYQDWLEYWPGLSREWQLRARAGGQRAERYQEAWRCYAAQLLDVGVLALDYLYERLIQMGEMGGRIRDLHTLYDLWIDAAEQAYAEVVSTPEFAKQQAEVVNAAVALKLCLHESLETVARINNLPTRAELDSAQRAIKELRAELADVRAQLAESTKPDSTRKRSRKGAGK